MADTDTPTFELKGWFNAERYRAIARELSKITRSFSTKRFLKVTLEGLENRTLMQRLRQTSVAVEASLPGTFRNKVDLLRELAPRIEHGFVAIFLSDFVAQYGLNDPTFSLGALRDFTRFGSSEFAVRPFLVRDQKSTLSVMLSWTQDGNEHVRRLASEGSRPRLPWGLRLQSLIRDPSPIAAILDALKCDEALYVRKSVANSLNDIAKDHPDWVLARLGNWDLSAAHTGWIAKRACRTLIKRGHPETLKLFGFDSKVAVNASLKLAPRRLALGSALTIEATIVSTSRKQQRLAIDYVIRYIKANGASSPKVFKWRELDLAPGETVSLRKGQSIRDFTTRTHFPGRHVVEIQVNGKRMAEASFDLSK
jgi:3-methyladenine DNA glycosylase AlkC